MLCPAGHVALVNPLVPTSRLPHLLLRRVEDDSPALHPVIVRVPWLRLASDRLLLPVHARVDCERDWVSALCFRHLKARGRAPGGSRGIEVGAGKRDSLSCAFDGSSPSPGSMVVSAVFVKENRADDAEEGPKLICERHLPDRWTEHVRVPRGAEGVSHLLMSRPQQRHSSLLDTPLQGFLLLQSSSLISHRVHCQCPR